MDQPTPTTTPNAATPSPVMPSGMPVAPAPVAKKGNKVLVIVLSILGGCCLLGLVLMIFLYFAGKKVVDESIKEFESNPDLQKAYELQEQYSDTNGGGVGTGDEETPKELQEFDSFFQSLNEKSNSSSTEEDANTMTDEEDVDTRDTDTETGTLEEEDTRSNDSTRGTTPDRY